MGVKVAGRVDPIQSQSRGCERVESPPVEIARNMAASGRKAPPSIGFLTVCDHDQQGLFGGYLVLNTTGRPVEFHCTAPVRASRAQEILYGATLRPYLYGEQIGQALLGKANMSPLAVFTDEQTVLAVRQFANIPVGCVMEDGRRDAPGPNVDGPGYSRIDSAHPAIKSPFAVGLREFSVGQQRVAVLETHEEDARIITQRCEDFADSFDLREPFNRIREAIDEARRTAR
jgi:hypothetical protein